MKPLLVLALLAAGAADARDLRPEILIEGRVDSVSVSPAGQLWIGTAVGEAYRSDDSGRTWSDAGMPVARRRDEIERVTFFDAKRAIVTGYMEDRVLLTGDAGATWETATLPEDGLWIYDSQALSDGHAWLVGSSGVVLGSADYGRTWRELAPPFAEIRRTYRIWFDTPDVGIAGSVVSGEVMLTRDGGASWQKFEARGRAEILRACGTKGDKDVTKTRIRDGRVIIRQCWGVFSSPIDGPREWTRVYAAGKPLTDFELGDAGQLIGITADRDVYLGDRDLGLRMDRPLQAMAASGKYLFLLDALMKVSAFDGEQWHVSRMIGQGVATSWPVTNIDRGPQDVLWGVSEYFLYRSHDGAKTWERIAELPDLVNHVLIQADGNVLLTGPRGWVGRWDASAQKLAGVPVLNGREVVGVFRRRDVWLAYGGRASGYIAASTDGGSTWKVVDTWKDEGTKNLFLSDDNRITVLSWLCGVRQGTLTLEPLGAKMQTLIPGSASKRTPYVRFVATLDLLRGDEGWISGNNDQVHTIVYHTTDGGRSWKKSDKSAYPGPVIGRLFDGTWLGYVPLYTMQRWTGTEFKDLPTKFPTYLAYSWIDSQGGYLMRFEDGSVHVLDPESGALRRLGES